MYPINPTKGRVQSPKQHMHKPYLFTLKHFVTKYLIQKDALISSIICYEYA